MIQLRNEPLEQKETVIEIGNVDCIEGMKRLPADSIDIVVTSPPYNLGIKYGKYNDTEHREKYLDWSNGWASQVKRLLKSDGSFFLNVGAAPSNPLLPHQLAVQFSKLFVLQNTFHWIKSITVQNKLGELISVGHFKPLSSYRYVTDCHEYVFHFTKLGNTTMDRLSIGVPYVDKSNINRWGHTNGNDKRCRGNNWFIPYKTIQNRSEQRPHPASFPVELAEQCIRVHGCEPGLTLMDPFLGIGNSAIAAKKCGVSKFVGFEIDPDYIQTAEEMLAL